MLPPERMTTNPHHQECKSMHYNDMKASNCSGYSPLDLWEGGGRKKPPKPSSQEDLRHVRLPNVASGIIGMVMISCERGFDPHGMVVGNTNQWYKNLCHKSKSAMGPGRDLEENASARIRNIETFEVGFKLFTKTSGLSSQSSPWSKLLTGNSPQISGEQRLPSLQGPRHLPPVQQRGWDWGG